MEVLNGVFVTNLSPTGGDVAFALFLSHLKAEQEQKGDS